MKNILFVLLFACSLASFSDVYKWVDENGKTHYSSQATEYTSKLALPGVNIPDNTIRKVKTNRPLYFDSKVPHKEIVIDDITMRVKGINPYVVNIGRYICNKNKPITWDNGRLSGSKQAFFSKAIELIFNDNNYNIKRRFPTFTDKRLRLKIEIQDLKVNFCHKKRLSGNYSNAYLSQASTVITVMWTLYDKKENKTIIETLTEGYFDGLNEPAAPNGLDFSISEAFKSAAKNLLSGHAFTSKINSLIPKDNREVTDKNSEINNRLPISVQSTELEYEALSLQFAPVEQLGSVFSYTSELEYYTAVISQSGVIAKGVFLNETGYVLTPHFFQKGIGPIQIEIEGALVNAQVIRADKKLNVSLLKINTPRYASTNINIKSLQNVDDALLFMIIEGSDGAPYLDELYLKESKTVDKIQHSSTLLFNASRIGHPLFNINGEFVGVVAGADSRNPSRHTVLSILPLFSKLNIKPILTSFSIDLDDKKISPLAKVLIITDRIKEWLNKPILTLE